ncbi:hypothetical protein [Brevibacillus laterosporus]|nr:hypothetical protein [Brevibacillus laterosporus]
MNTKTSISCTLTKIEVLKFTQALSFDSFVADAAMFERQGSCS